MISLKSAGDIEKMRRAGAILAELLMNLKDFVKRGSRLPTSTVTPRTLSGRTGPRLLKRGTWSPGSLILIRLRYARR